MYNIFDEDGYCIMNGLSTVENAKAAIREIVFFTGGYKAGDFPVSFNINECEGLRDPGKRASVITFNVSEVSTDES